MDMDFEKTLAILNGESVDNLELNQITEIDRIQVTNALELIFQGLSLRNWLAGGILRDAWQNALDQLREWVFSIQTINPITVFARSVTFEMRTTWTEKMRTAPRTNMLIQCTDEQRIEWSNNADVKIQNGTELLMKKINGYITGTPNEAKQTIAAQAPTFQQIFDSRIREENQRVRERKFPN